MTVYVHMVIVVIYNYTDTCQRIECVVYGMLCIYCACSLLYSQHTLAFLTHTVYFVCCVLASCIVTSTSIFCHLLLIECIVCVVHHFLQ